MRGKKGIVAVFAVAGALAVPASAGAGSVKQCPYDGPGKANFTAEQKGSCNSSHDEVVKNPGGQTPGGKQ